MNQTGGLLENVRSEIARAAEKSGRGVDEIELVAVSKKQDAEKVRAAFDAGQAVFGESRVQEARAKIPLLPSAVRWHFIGRLQKNKIRHALPLFELFHSVDSLAVAQEMDRIAGGGRGASARLAGGERGGGGEQARFRAGEIAAEMETLLALGRLEMEGLMTIPPFAPEAEASRRYFVALRELRDGLEREFAVRLPQLSMGMSGDFAVAIEEGATLVRVGTAIFGERS